ncbi:hypothetical protein [Candidatus Viridilinea mediisalina]|uniref:Uncharacterized protein n=1 Tax=Candidatus Viridilinea mediisalina TaxID=2024553 RepID=A0A2A6RF60_9CHLR|nr:hypothetical protein [Candidatus Viridilinea mediisalina]PDW01508.1 hypothetical protein CJ255_18745 [Candidatus Viridilinea mediisalina]
MNTLKLHDLRLQQLAEKLSANGTLVYGIEHLHYAAVRKLVTSPSAANSFIKRALQLLTLGIICFIVGCVVLDVIANNPAAGIPILMGAMLIVGIGLIVWVLRAERRRYPPLPISVAQFTKQIIKPYYEVYGSMPQGLLDDQQRNRLSSELPAPQNLRGAVVCPNRTMCEVLLANGVPDRFGLAVLPAHEPFNPAEQAHLEQLRQQPRLPLLLLHDASPQGCLWATQALATLGLTAAPERRVVALGLRPRTVLKRNVMTLKAKPNEAILQQLQQGGKLTAEELAWLQAGNYTPITVLPPARLLALIERVRLRPLTPPAAPQSEPAPEQVAQAIGFMSWPRS